jgi:hypothetical protein
MCANDGDSGDGADGMDGSNDGTELKMVLCWLGAKPVTDESDSNIDWLDAVYGVEDWVREAAWPALWLCSQLRSR